MTPGKTLLRFSRQQPLGAVGGLFILCMVLAALFAELLATYDPIRTDAEHTLKITLDAAEEGNLRLAASRGITAIIQATAAAVGAAPPIIRRAEAILGAARRLGLLPS